MARSLPRPRSRPTAAATTTTTTTPDFSAARKARLNECIQRGTPDEIDAHIASRTVPIMYGDVAAMAGSACNQPSAEVFHCVMRHAAGASTLGMSGLLLEQVGPVMRNVNLSVAASLLSVLIDSGHLEQVFVAIKKFLRESFFHRVLGERYVPALLWFIQFEGGVLLPAFETMQYMGSADYTYVEYDDVEHLRTMLPENMALLRERASILHDVVRHILLSITFRRGVVERLIWDDARFYPTDKSLPIRVGMVYDRRHDLGGDALHAAFVYARAAYGVGRGEIDTMSLIDTALLGGLRMPQMRIVMVLLTEGGGYLDFTRVVEAIRSGGMYSKDETTRYALNIARGLLAGCDRPPKTLPVKRKALGGPRAVKSVARDAPPPPGKTVHMIGMRRAPVVVRSTAPAPAPAPAAAPVARSSDDDSDEVKLDYGDSDDD